jgi:hypothetical protein
MQLGRLAILAVSAAVMSGISTVYATPISNSTVGIANPVFTQTFDSTPFTINTLINSSFNQITSSGLFYDGNTGAGACAFFEESGNCVSNFTTNGNQTAINKQPTFSIFFAAPQTSVAFAMVTGGPDNDTFTAFLKGQQVATFSAVTLSNYSGTTPNTVGNFFGFSNIRTAFDQIMGTTTGSNLVVLDNIQLSAAVPEPGTIALFGLGIGGLVALRRRRRAT